MNPKLLPPGRLRYMRLRQHPMREAGWSTAPPPKPRALSREMPPDQPWQCHGLLCTAPPNAPTEERCLGCGRDPDGFDRDGYDDHGYDHDDCKWFVRPGCRGGRRGCYTWRDHLG